MRPPPAPKPEAGAATTTAPPATGTELRGDHHGARDDRAARGQRAGAGPGTRAVHRLLELAETGSSGGPGGGSSPAPSRDGHRHRGLECPTT